MLTVQLCCVRRAIYIRIALLRQLIARAAAEARRAFRAKEASYITPRAGD